MKKLYFLILFLQFFDFSNAQIITFKDPYFKEFLVNSSETTSTARDIDGKNLKIDINGNREIEESELLAVAYLKIGSFFVKDLTGILKFVNLVELDVTSCYLSSLDLSGLKKLKTVKCATNNLTTLTLTGLTNLENLDCSGNSIASLDIAGFTKIKSLSVSKNRIVSLDLLSFKDLETLSVESNLLKTLNVSNLGKLTNLKFYSNPLTVVNTANCIALKSISLDSFNLESADISGCTNLEELNLLYSSIKNLNAENCINLKTIKGTDQYGGGGTKFSFKNCKNLQGIKFINFYVSEIDFSNCSALTNIEVNNINMQKLVLAGCISLNTLAAKNNRLESLDLTDCINLEKVAVEVNKLTNLQVAGKKIQELTCQVNLLTDLNLSGFDKLETLDCGSNKLASVNITGAISLKKFKCNTNLLSAINIKESVNLEELNCTENKLTGLNISKLSKLKNLSFSNNDMMKSLNASDCILLENLSIDNPLEDINLSGCAGLKYFYVVKTSNSLPHPKLLNLNMANCSGLLTFEVKSKIVGNIDLTNCSMVNSVKIGWGTLDNIIFKNNSLLTNIFFDNVTFVTTVDLRSVNALTYLNFESCKAPYIDVSNLPNLLSFSGYNVIALDNVNAYGCSKLKAYEINTKKLNLKNCTSIKSIYYNNNSNIETLDVSGCTSLETLTVSYKGFNSLNILGCDKLKTIGLYDTAMTGMNVSNLPGLTNIAISNSKSFSNITFSNVPSLTHIGVTDTSITSLDVHEIKTLESLYCGGNLLSSLNIEGLTNITELSCQENKLTTLDISKLKKLTKLNFVKNEIRSIDLKGYENLTHLECSENPLTELNLSGCANITYLICSNNDFTTLDLNDLTKLTTFFCNGNTNLNSIFLNNLDKKTNISFYLNSDPNLKYICVDESRIETFQKEVYRLRYFNCNVNSYCSFKPNGAYTMMQGNIRLDANENGCDLTDALVSHIKFQIKSNLTEGTVISDNTGSYAFPIQEGNYEITPKLENPNYFVISPSSLNVKFENPETPVNQDFCIVANGSRKDLEIVLIPLEPARPGFDAKYKLVYKNKGNTKQSGIVNLTFDDAILDFLQSNPSVSGQATNKLSWNFSDLKPFESREIIFTVNVNSPTEMPAVNNGDRLKYSTSVVSGDIDETPLDNIFDFNQEVVGSYDPNDKTCLEGSVITPNLIGEYVHYMIRFENTGTYPAQNIVVKDIIDLNKFDISTLIPTSSSHSFVTKISEGNKVEFIFENINLPFDDANNNGYVAFKIKTKSTLKVGDSFSNDANIYFDYNFPILTNKATSTFKTNLGTTDFDFSKYFVLYPNPSTQILNISQTENTEIQSFEIYDILGQLIIVVPNAKTTSAIDVSKLKTGNYFIRVKSDRGSSSMKFIKI